VLITVKNAMGWTGVAVLIARYEKAKVRESQSLAWEAFPVKRIALAIR